ncbi:hypothetical protein ABZ667_43900 [Streptomyces lavendulae]|uniref:hypothetical protein n=1 Tax=Streptomyces lavendulae TaxID=1914 RepID=UPI0033C9C173
MATDFVITRYEKLFDAAVVDGAGTIEWKDYEDLADRILTAYRVRSDDMRAKALRDAYRLFWTGLTLRDEDAGVRLSRLQFVRAMGTLAAGAVTAPMLEALHDALFDLADVNGDGELDKDEFISFVKATTGTSEARALNAFTRLTAESAGPVDRERLIRSFREFLTSDEASEAAAGGAALGAL